MEVIHDCVAGLDVHKDRVVACVRTMSGNKATRECRTFETTTDGLSGLLEWLSSSRCAVVAAMEATGVFWRPVWKILSDGDFELILANAAHIKAVPGRKTDINDAMWIADLAAYGLIKASFVTDEKLHELRTLMRTRKQLVREQTRQVQRIQKTLTEANIRLDSVISDVMGASGRRVIKAMIEGERDPRKLAALADRRVKATPKELYDALRGRLTICAMSPKVGRAFRRPYSRLPLLNGVAALGDQCPVSARQNSGFLEADSRMGAEALGTGSAELPAGP